jgi:hypothetical protein
MEKLNMNQSRSIFFALITCVLIFVPACNMFEWQYEEIERFASPDGIVDAVWVRGSGGATTGFVFDLYIVPKGLKFEKDATSFKHAVFSGDHFEDLRIVWREPKLLEIQFKHAMIFGYRNYWQYWNPDSPEVYRPYVVETRLVHTIEDSMLTERDRS